MTDLGRRQRVSADSPAAQTTRHLDAPALRNDATAAAAYHPIMDGVALTSVLADGSVMEGSLGL
jgi:hypothetical protein